MSFRKIYTILFIICCFQWKASANEKLSIAFDWQSNKTFHHPENKSNIPTFSGAFHDGKVDYLPTITVRAPITSKTDQVKVILSNEVWEDMDVQLTIDISTDIIMNSDIAIEKHRYFALAQILPVRNMDGKWQRLLSCNIQFTPKHFSSVSSSQWRGTGTYPDESVLQTGNWFKISVDKAGVYKLDYNFLQTLGLNAASIDPSKLKIYGHGAGALPELAGSTPYTDPVEIPIQVVSSGSTFKQGDYILAYLSGPERIDYNSSNQRFSHSLHPYSFKKYFFITADGNSGNRITVASSPPGSETATINSFDDYQFKETETRNVGLTGKLWLGDEFGIISNRNYNFSFSSIESTTPATITISTAAFSQSGSTVFQTSLNGDFLGNLSISQTPSFSGVVDYGRAGSAIYSVPFPADQFDFSINFQRNGAEATGWLDYLAVQCRRNLNYEGQAFIFRSIQNIGSGKISRFNITNATASLQVWDVTDPLLPYKVSSSFSSGTASFKVNTDTIRTFIAFETSSVAPEPAGTVKNQNLHATGQHDMVIISRPSLLSDAESLAQLHQNLQGMDVLAVTYEQVCNEFSGGTPDATAIRNFIKMLYDRAEGNPDETPKYLLLYGDGTYNNRNLGEYLLPTYQSTNSLGAIQSYVSDDFFGLLDDNEGGDIDNTFSRLMDVAVGRIPAENSSRSSIAMSKIQEYVSQLSLGNWKNELCFIADDEDNNIHIDDADGIANTLANQYPQYNIDKIYLDAYTQQSTASGSRYPEVNAAIARKLFSGVRVMNYLGHGGINGLAKERIVTFDDINSWENPGKLPFFVTATCEFTRYDEADQFTGGERVFFKENGGAIAMLTTTRVVFSNQNELINRNFMNRMLLLDSIAGSTLGDAILLAKNATNTGIGNRKFALIGDPALPLAFPLNKVSTTLINGQIPSSGNDTLKALSRVDVSGEVRSPGGFLLTDFNGTANIKIFDKPKVFQTLSNDPSSLPTFFNLQKNVIYSGKAKVSNGKFTYSFVVPKDIDFIYGNGKFSYYAENGITDAAGYDQSIIIGGVNDTAAIDNEGPLVEVFMENEDWGFGGITTPDPDLLVDLFDDNGINASGNGIGHDIIAVLDEDTRNQLTLNEYYEATLDDFRAGKIRYPLSKLSAGRHSLRVKAWDTYNNSGQGYTEFIVEETAELALEHILNYPNPFTTNTEFSFDHNRPGQNLDIKIEIYTVSGKVVKTIRQQVIPEGFRVSGIQWDGKDDYGDNIGKGVYVYRVSVQDGNGQKIRQYQKLVVLK